MCFTTWFTSAFPRVLIKNFWITKWKNKRKKYFTTQNRGKAALCKSCRKSHLWAILYYKYKVTKSVPDSFPCYDSFPLSLDSRSKPASPVDRSVPGDRSVPWGQREVSMYLLPSIYTTSSNHSYSTTQPYDFPPWTTPTTWSLPRRMCALRSSCDVDVMWGLEWNDDVQVA
jgi:hypothetical protein